MAAHLIHRIRLDLRTHDRATAASIQEAAARCARDQFPALVEAFLDARCPSGVHQRIDRLEIDLGHIPPGRFQKALAESLARALEKLPLPAQLQPPRPTPAFPTDGRRQPSDQEPDAQTRPELSKVLPDAEVQPPRPTPAFPTDDRRQPPGQEPDSRSRQTDADLSDAFLQYVVTGTLPWWCPVSRWCEELSIGLLLESSLPSPLREQLPSLLRSSPRRVLRLLPFPELVETLFAAETGALRETPAFRRLMGSMNRREQLRWKAAIWLLSLFPAGAGESTHAQQTVRELLQWHDAPSTPPAWLSTFREFPAETGDGMGSREAELVSLLAEVLETTARALAQPTEAPPPPSIPSESEPHSPHQKTAETEPVESTEREGLTTESAGLVLLHPFLASFFQNLGWLDQRKRFLPGRRWDAVQTLHWLAHQRTATDETALVLERTLCGIPLLEPGDLPELNPAIVTEGEELLQAVLGHWSALKNTTPEGLREAFLARPGLLYLTEAPRLRVETRAYDILLGRLPWSLDRALLPWLRQPLMIDWPAPS